MFNSAKKPYYFNLVSITTSLCLFCFLLGWTTQPVKADNHSSSNPSSTTENDTDKYKVSFTIDEEGKAKDVKLVESTGSKELDAAIIKMVEKWQFDPVEEPQVVTATVSLNLDAPAANAYPQIIVDSFIEGCTKDEEEIRPFCVCAIGELQKTVPLDEFVEFSLSVADKPNDEIPDQLKPRMATAFANCADSFPSEQKK